MGERLDRPQGDLRLTPVRRNWRDAAELDSRFEVLSRAHQLFKVSRACVHSSGKRARPGAAVYRFRPVAFTSRPARRPESFSNWVVVHQPLVALALTKERSPKNLM